jgi:hypothetical protein
MHHFRNCDGILSFVREDGKIFAENFLTYGEE